MPSQRCSQDRSGIETAKEVKQSERATRSSNILVVGSRVAFPFDVRPSTRIYQLKSVALTE